MRTSGGIGQRRRQATIAALAVWTAASLLPGGSTVAADHVGSGGRVAVVSGSRLDPGKTRRAEPDAGPTRRSRANAQRLKDRPAKPARPGPAPLASEASEQKALGAEDASTALAGPLPSGVSALSRLIGDPSNKDVTVAAGSVSLMTASGHLISTFDRVALTDEATWWPYDFFALPLDEYYAVTTVAYSIHRGRFVAVMPSIRDESSGCPTGYLNLAVSSTASPSGTWTRYRIPMPDAWSDRATIGFSDDHLVMTTNEWDLDPTTCLGSGYEGSRIRVVDWADLIDGGTLTTRDVTPSEATSYWSWMAAQEVPGPATTNAGSVAHLVGDAYVGEWGHVVYATLTGSAKAGTTALTAPMDLTASGAIPLLVGPPAILAIPGGGSFDESHVGVASRSGRLWFVANGACTPAGDDAVRACARFVELDTTTASPAVVQDGFIGTDDRDTFLPGVGMTRDGQVQLRLSDSSAISWQPVDQLLVNRAPGEAVGGGSPPVRFHIGDDTLRSSEWARFAAFAPDPLQPDTAWHVGPVVRALYANPVFLTRFRGNLSDAPSGTITVNSGRPWSRGTRAEIAADPLGTSPIIWARVSASSTTEATPGGGRLVNGVDFPSSPWIQADVGSSALGGTPGEGPHTVYVQWQTSDGTWSVPIERTFSVDLGVPDVTVPVSRFEVGRTVGSTAPVRTSWTGSDALSGIQSYTINRNMTGGSGAAWSVTPPTTFLIQGLALSKTYRYMVDGVDRAGNSAETAYGPNIAPRAYQGTTSAISYYTTFSTASGSSYLGGSTRYSSRAGARATFTFTGRAVAIVATRARTRGKFEVWVDGVKKATIDTYSSTTKYRQVVWAASWPTSGSHKVMLKVLGTSGRPRVDVDAFLKI